jgi:ABC-type iron transport system FetAB ATPase subunit
MRILELEIQNVRGIRSLRLSPNGQNFAIWGPNGSGKSAVVDAIDFLLTGRISRLTGKGTGGITLKRYGPHIDYSPEEAYVYARVEMPGIDQPVELRRCIAEPDNLQCDEAIKPVLAPILEVAKRGQHVLSRREILRYIAAESSSRAQEIQELLNISDIETIRKSFVRVCTAADREVEAQNKIVETAKGAVNATVQSDLFDESLTLGIINRNREILGGKPFYSLKTAELKNGITLPKSASGEQSINVTVLERDIQNLTKLISDEHKSSVSAFDGKLRLLLKTIRSDPKLLRALSRLQLLQLGISLMDETGVCPLCETDWPPGKLLTQLNDRLSAAEVALENQNKIEGVSRFLKGYAETSIASLDKIIASLQSAVLNDYLPHLEAWRNELLEFTVAISDPLNKYPASQYSESQVAILFSPSGIGELLENVLSKLKAKYPETSPELTAWTTLTRLEENLKGLEVAMDAHSAALTFQSRAHALMQSFLASRDQVLGKLYDAISTRFSELYKALHGPDEEGFIADIQPDGAGLAFEVDFYGRGKHPPLALHSEGHQDSMGVCLYLALSERLTQGLINITILDDVIMSVDASHRRKVCSILSKYFPDKQFLITTHDKTWSNQLKSEGVIRSSGMIEFYNWNIETGPHVNYEVDIWDRIGKYLEANDVPSAAALLRRGLEEFFAYVCDTLEADVRYQLDGSNDLGDFLPAAMGKYRSLLKKAKKSAQSWTDTKLFEQLNEIDSTVSPIYARTYAEQWAVNANVHFNNWATFSREDFTPVVEAFQDLQSLFICQNCGTIFRIAKQGTTPVSVRCNCGSVNWNLVTKAT